MILILTFTCCCSLQNKGLGWRLSLALCLNSLCWASLSLVFNQEGKKTQKRISVRLKSNFKHDCCQQQTKPSLIHLECKSGSLFDDTGHWTSRTPFLVALEMSQQSKHWLESLRLRPWHHLPVQERTMQTALTWLAHPVGAVGHLSPWHLSGDPD